LDISNCDMEKGGMRLEANISLRNDKSISNNKLPNYKVELKNINSFRFLERGIEYEIERQKEILETGKTPVQETRGYNAEKNITYTQRTKESAADYRYFPDPDLPPIRINDEWMKEINKSIPKDFDQRLDYWHKEYNVKREFIEELFETAGEANWFEELFKKLKSINLDSGKLVNLILHKKININLFKDDFDKIIGAFKKETVVSDISDEELIVIIKKILLINQKAMNDYKAGKKQVMNFLAGMVIREAKKKIDFGRLEKLIQSSIK
jgi:aspartyl-tRNA(Asn)/glutamyl-tRNA(Gln) amidotransferase subunit B